MSEETAHITLRAGAREIALRRPTHGEFNAITALGLVRAMRETLARRDALEIDPPEDVALRLAGIYEQLDRIHQETERRVRRCLAATGPSDAASWYEGLDADGRAEVLVELLQALVPADRLGK
jgi:hypothetical protein